MVRDDDFGRYHFSGIQDGHSPDGLPRPHVCLVPDSDGASCLSRQEEDALWLVLFTALLVVAITTIDRSKAPSSSDPPSDRPGSPGFPTDRRKAAL
jgi:hypothetical protein